MCDADYQCIINKTWKETLEIKARAHYFVDQLSKGSHFPSIGYDGGLGKSGLEAMLLKCLTFCGGKPVKSDIDIPPYIVCNTVEELINEIEYYHSNPEKCEALIERQYRWAVKHTNAEEVALRILEPCGL